MKTVSIFNNKGGVGKTTLAVHLALYATQHQSLRTVAIGLDRQGDMLRWLSGGNTSVSDGSVYEHSKLLTVVYSPNQQPNLPIKADLCILDAPPSLALAATLRPDLWVVPVDGRLALEDMHNALPDLEASRAKILVVINKADSGGARTLGALKRAVEQTPKISIWPTPVPDSPAVKRAAEYYRAVWDVPYGQTSEGHKAIVSLCSSMLKLVGLGGATR